MVSGATGRLTVRIIKEQKLDYEPEVAREIIKRDEEFIEATINAIPKISANVETSFRAEGGSIIFQGREAYIQSSLESKGPIFPIASFESVLIVTDQFLSGNVTLEEARVMSEDIEEVEKEGMSASIFRAEDIENIEIEPLETISVGDSIVFSEAVTFGGVPRPRLNTSIQIVPTSEDEQTESKAIEKILNKLKRVGFTEAEVVPATELTVTDRGVDIKADEIDGATLFGIRQDEMSTVGGFLKVDISRPIEDVASEVID